MSIRPVISVSGLVKDYQNVRAVDNIDFHVERGEIFALLGTNGAGKTTTVEILTGHKKRTGGKVDVLGFDPWSQGPALRQHIGVVLQRAGIDPDLTVEETTRLFSGFYRRGLAPGYVLDQVGLLGKRKIRVRALSGGQLRRLDLAIALVGEPELLFLDEPTTGLDPQHRRQAWDLIKELKCQGRSVLLTSHYMDEVQTLADRVAVVSHGLIVEEGTPSKLAGRDLADATISFRLPHPSWASDLPPGPYELVSPDGDVVMRTPEPTRVLSVLTSWAVEHGGELIGLTVSRPSLEDAYLSITREHAR